MKGRSQGKKNPNSEYILYQLYVGWHQQQQKSSFNCKSEIFPEFSCPNLKSRHWKFELSIFDSDLMFFFSVIPVWKSIREVHPSNLKRCKQIMRVCISIQCIKNVSHKAYHLTLLNSMTWNTTTLLSMSILIAFKPLSKTDTPTGFVFHVFIWDTSYHASS